MGCGTSQEECVSPRPASLLEKRDSFGRVTVPAGKRRLDLNEQRLEKLPVCLATDKVLALNLSDNLLRELPSGMGSNNWVSLQELLLMNNHLTTVPGVLPKLPELTTLSLAGNRFESVESFKILKGCNKLTRLSIANCHMASIPAGILDNNILQELNLSRNAGFFTVCKSRSVWEC
eukprot:TRINITY_DN16190_c0_g1_i1.p1 TRINITY_DN16190_c0_g1~~TRINITY_DN16190_c0_g1_i1.p1  ORF type:complete len:189 (+),score=18.46 TRINITY_DN16190_c0_g1_i1:41-568(+)